MTKQKNIRVITCRVGEKPKVEIIENTLANLQKLVGGYIEVVYLDDIIMIINEEGKLDGLKPNFLMPHDVIVGDVLFVGDDGEEFGSLTTSEVFTVLGFLASIGRCKVEEITKDIALDKELMSAIVKAGVKFND